MAEIFKVFKGRFGKPFPTLMDPLPFYVSVDLNAIKIFQSLIHQFESTSIRHNILCVCYIEAYSLFMIIKVHLV